MEDNVTTTVAASENSDGFQKQPEHYGYFAKRFRRPACSRRIILSCLRTFKECDILLWQSSAIPTLRFSQDAATLNPCCSTGGTYSLNAVMDYPRFRSRKCVEVCSKSGDPQLTMQWMKEVERARSEDEIDFRENRFFPTTI